MDNLYKILNEHSTWLCFMYLVLMSGLTRLYINKKLISNLNQNYPGEVSIKGKGVWSLSFLSFLIISIGFYFFDHWSLKILIVTLSVITFNAAMAAVHQKFWTIFLWTLLLLPTFTLLTALYWENIFPSSNVQDGILIKIVFLLFGISISLTAHACCIIRLDPFKLFSKA